MNITVPVAGEQTGPTWAQNIQDALYLTIDQHDHTDGRGVPIPSAGLSIDDDLEMNNENLIEVKTVRFEPQSASITASSPNVGCLYVRSGVSGTGIYDLYYNDGGGNQVRLTQSGSVAGSAGSITGMSGNAAVVFSTPTYRFYTDSTTVTNASVDCRNIILRNSSANSYALTISPPAAMVANIAYTLPAIPAATYVLAMDSSGNITAAANQVTTAQIAALNVTRAKLEVVGQQVSSSCGSYSSASTTYATVTNLNVTITTTGRPVMLMIQNLSGSEGYYGSVNAATYNLRIVRGATVVGFTRLQIAAGIYLPMSFSVMDVVAAGTYTYEVSVKSSSGAAAIEIVNCVLVAYEL